MPALEPGRYVCVRTPGLLAWIIRRACRSQYNHAVIVTADGGIIEARPAGVRKGTLSEYAGMLAVANTRELMSGTQLSGVTAASEAYLGDGYNWPELVAIGLEDLGWHWRVLFRFAGLRRAFICSALVAACGAAAGLDWKCGSANPAQVTPAMLARRTGMEPVTIPEST